MKFFIPCLLFISLILFVWLLMSNINQTKVTASLNELEINSQVEKPTASQKSAGLKNLPSKKLITLK
ncbi:hypothetical protein ACFQO9_13730 [Chryseobacterium zhengzhouense]|uniref:Uncharacterized protein n=1 Tax=Chryseobacterium zhengzhouense TaxID=1636086 RepID=A0ABW2M4D9_9FLAO